ncbi:YD repeat-containing protein [Flavobacterium sp. 9]|uniref:SprB repeat-containing protein n=1 Tax=Flavobacterium sp. 9 TaxID=2035198 RepID=UPI000C19335B|nr:SprB repeat-containing protein [Flavobacterium sp. 9]PIF32334.1 YD repeat-containing protein [Flavobacterium sp. 9]
MRKIILLLSFIIIASCSSDEPTKTPVKTEPEVVIKPLAATFTKIDVAVYGGNTGSVTFIPSGGTPPYTISPSQTGLKAGNYTFIITDSKGLTLSITTEITQSKAVLPQSGLLKPAVKNINKKSASGKRSETVKHLVQSIQYDKDKYVIDPTSDSSLTDNLYAASEDALNANTPKGDVRTYTYNDLGQLIRIDILKGPNSLGSSGIEFSYEYDSNGNVINNKTPYTYENGLITNVLIDGYSTTYTYDSSGRVIHRAGSMNASTFEYTDTEVKETRYEVIPSQGEVANGRVVITKYDGTKAGIYNNEPYYKIATTFSSLLGQTLPNPYLHVIEQKLVDNGEVQKTQTYKYFYDTDGYLIKVDDGVYVTVYIYQ